MATRKNFGGVGGLGYLGTGPKARNPRAMGPNVFAPGFRPGQGIGRPPGVAIPDPVGPPRPGVAIPDPVGPPRPAEIETSGGTFPVPPSAPWPPQQPVGPLSGLVERPEDRVPIPTRPPRPSDISVLHPYEGGVLTASPSDGLMSGMSHMKSSRKMSKKERRRRRKEEAERQRNTGQHQTDDPTAPGYMGDVGRSGKQNERDREFREWQRKRNKRNKPRSIGDREGFTTPTWWEKVAGWRG
jgi:hypothetical protein